MNLKQIMQYLSELDRNNNREWYHAHKAERQEANAQFEALIEELILRIGIFDKQILPCPPRELTFKLVRDTRFSHDKSPYNPAFRAHIGPKGKLPIPVGYYLMLRPNNQSFLGGGLFADIFTDATARIRSRIAEYPAEWEQIIQNKDFTDTFTLQGTALKRIPAGYDKEHPQAEYLKYKSWYLEYPIQDQELEDSEHFLALAEHIFQKMKPFHDFLNQALEGFEMPKR